MLYHLALETIYRMFADLRSTGTLQTTFEGEPRRATYTARVVILEGKLANCAIFAGNGEIVAQGNDAYNMIAQRTLKWEFTPMRPSSLSPSLNQFSPAGTGRSSTSPGPQPTRVNQRVPVRTREVAPGELSAWPRQLRTIYSLINGIHTVNRIEQLTSLPANTIENVLHQLEERGYITWLQ